MLEKLDKYQIPKGGFSLILLDSTAFLSIKNQTRLRHPRTIQTSSIGSGLDDSNGEKSF